jgi:hypothetical protein
MSTELFDVEFDLNDLPELPEFVTWPAGSYEVEGVSLRTEDNEKMGKIIVFEVLLKTVNEVKPADAVLPAVETKQSWNFPFYGKDDRGTEFAQGRIRNILTPFAIAYGTANSQEIAAKFAGTKFTLITNVRTVKGKEGEEDKTYSGIKSVIIG